MEAAARSPAREALATLKRNVVEGALRMLPDSVSVQVQYLRAYRRLADLDRPRRFTEKLQWLKLYGGLDAHSAWVDKIRAKEKVAALLGERWITPTLWHGPALPPREERTWPTPYLIKASHGSGWYRHVVTDADRDWPAIEAQCESWLRRRWHPHLRERQYATVPPQLLVEPRLGGTAEVIPYDYKFGVFNGRAEFCGVSMGRLQGVKFAAMDRDWKRLPFTLDNTPLSPVDPPRPPHFDEMVAAAELLGRPFAYARVDLYDLPEGPRFGEITLTPGSGHLAVGPDDWDFRIGDMLSLPARAATPPDPRD